MIITIKTLTRRIVAAIGLGLAAAGAAHADGIVGTSLPAEFPVILDASLGKPVIGFGATGRASRTPVIFLHGNNDAPYNAPASCATGADIQSMAQYFANNGYSPSELWALGYQGDQCDLFVEFGTQVNRSSVAHTNAANVPDLRQFVRAVLASTGARQIDIVAHGMGVTLAREWVRQDDIARRVRRFVAIEGPNRGMITCSADPLNPWQSRAAGAYPGSPVCAELGSPDTPFLRRLNRSTNQIDPADTLVVRNIDASCLFMLPDGLGCGTFGTLPTVDSFGNPADFSLSARLPRTRELGLSNQSSWDFWRFTSHVGIANSPTTQRAAFAFLTRR
jgi:pimeloyl-ACP methyl ester carboxylesterase